jgi:hypothetical protein
MVMIPTQLCMCHVGFCAAATAAAAAVVAVQVEAAVELVGVAAVLVGSSSGPPSQSLLVPPLQW